MGPLKGRPAEETAAVIRKLLGRFPISSISLDNGSEFAEFRLQEPHFSALIYFAEPHKPWQRGTNENANDLIRSFSQRL